MQQQVENHSREPFISILPTHSSAFLPGTTIDDADALFEDGEERGLYRYLLTMLDGLESEGTARVCVMMTAMNLQHLPPALVRSGRVELWLEMKLPDADARSEILKAHLKGISPSLASCNVDEVIAATDAFTGADMKSLVADAKGLYAFGRATGLALRPATEYFLESANGVRENKRRYEEAERASRANTRGVPNPFDFVSRMAIRKAAQQHE